VLHWTERTNDLFLQLRIARIITQRELDFYETNMRKRNLTDRQSKWMEDIEWRIVLGMRKTPSCPACRKPSVPKFSREGREFYVCPHCPLDARGYSPIVVWVG
jgi:hypothetical protein